MLPSLNSGNVGDIIASIPAIYDLNRRFGDGKPSLYLFTNVVADYHPSRKHPCGKVRMSDSFAETFIPLLQSQKTFNVTKIWNMEPIDVDLDLFRKLPIHFAYHNLSRWYGYTFQCNPDLTQPWLHVAKKRCEGKVVFSRSAGYRNNGISYRSLEPFSPIFLGLENEYKEIRKECRTATWFETTNYLELAECINGCKAFIGNQSSVFWLAEALKVPRLLEVCPYAPNVHPTGGICHMAISQFNFDFAVQDLLGVPDATQNSI